jgi:hypothetical protein
MFTVEGESKSKSWMHPSATEKVLTSGTSEAPQDTAKYPNKYRDMYLVSK